MRRLVFLAFLVVSTVLPFFSFDGYSLIRHTTSHLGAQGSPHAWVMNVTFFLLGTTAFIVSWQKNVWYHRVFGGLFGLSLFLTGVFHHAPLVEGVTEVVWQDTWHSVFATTTGICFTMLATGHTFMTRGVQRRVAYVMAGIAVVIPVGMFLFPDVMGLLQRIMFISAFGWLFFYMDVPLDFSTNAKRTSS